jgi:hypothetical protein
MRLGRSAGDCLEWHSLVPAQIKTEYIGDAAC